MSLSILYFGFFSDIEDGSRNYHNNKTKCFIISCKIKRSYDAFRYE